MKSSITTIILFFLFPVLHAQGLKSFEYKPVCKANTEVIRTLSRQYPEELWHFPGKELSDTAKDNFNLFGAERVKPIYNIKDIEPSSISNIKVLSNGNVLLICTSKLKYFFSECEIFIKVIKVYLPEEVNVYLLEKNTGKIIWESKIDAYGLFTIGEQEDYISIESQHYSTDGVKGRKITLLEKLTGKLIIEKGNILTEKIFQYPEQGLFALAEKDTTNENTMLYALYKINESKPVFIHQFNRQDFNFMPRVHNQEVMFLSDNVISIFHIKKPAEKQLIKVDNDIEAADIMVLPDMVIIPGKQNISAYDNNTGKKIWDYPYKREEYAGLQFTEGQIYLVHQTEKTKILDRKTQKLLDKRMKAHRICAKYKKKPFDLIEIDRYDYLTRIDAISLSGNNKWEAKVDGNINSNIFKSVNNTYFTTEEKFYCIDNTSGKVIKQYSFPRKEKFRRNMVNCLHNKVFVRNEEMVWCFNAENLDSLYAHEFQSVWPVITEEMLNKDIETCNRLLGYISGTKTSSHHYQYNSFRNTYNNHYNAAIRTGGVSASTARSLAGYHQTLDNLSGNIQNSINLSISMIQMARTADLIIMFRAILSEFTAHPYIRFETEQLMNTDNDEIAVRLVQINTDGQKFIALEMLELEKGVVRSQLLSPLQFKDSELTMYNSVGKMSPERGYIQLLNLRDHLLRTAIDPDNKLIYHYGPGLNVESYQYYGKDKEFARGKIFCLPCDFKVEKRYL